MKPIAKLKKAIQEYEEETGTIIHSIEINERMLIDNQGNRKAIDFNINIDVESL